MLLVHQDLARARIQQRLGEAEAMRLARIARARRARPSRSAAKKAVSAATSRARLIVAYGSPR